MEFSVESQKTKENLYIKVSIKIYPWLIHMSSQLHTPQYYEYLYRYCCAVHECSTTCGMNKAESKGNGAIELSNRQ